MQRFKITNTTRAKTTEQRRRRAGWGTSVLVQIGHRRLRPFRHILLTGAEYSRYEQQILTYGAKGACTVVELGARKEFVRQIEFPLPEDVQELPLELPTPETPEEPPPEESPLEEPLGEEPVSMEETPEPPIPDTPAAPVLDIYDPRPVTSFSRATLRKRSKGELQEMLDKAGVGHSKGLSKEDLLDKILGVA